jgi:hypothetical protein
MSALVRVFSAASAPSSSGIATASSPSHSSLMALAAAAFSDAAASSPATAWGVDYLRVRVHVLGGFGVLLAVFDSAFGYGTLRLSRWYVRAAETGGKGFNKTHLALCRGLLCLLVDSHQRLRNLLACGVRL